MDAKRKFSQEKELCSNDGKRKKVVTPENQGAGGNGTRIFSETEVDVFIDVPVVSSNLEEKVFERDHSTGSGRASSSRGGREGLANDLSLHENEFVEVHVTTSEEETLTNKTSEEEIMKDKDKRKAIIDLEEDTWPKEETVSNTFEKHGEVSKNCEHFWIWKDGLGHFCWKCDIIGKKHPLPPGYGSSNVNGIKLEVPENGFSGTGIFPHPRRKTCMKPHQVKILNFLCSNLAVENPNGCILAQAPISEKTFLMINLIHGYLVKHPSAKPLLVLPKSMINFWKKEFQGFEVNDIMLLDFYSAKANTRPQQLEVLKQWITNRSIMFLGHKQFSNMVSDKNDTQASNVCRDILLNESSLVILDRGTDPRNEMMSFLKVFARIKTPRKLLLSGTLYQSHVKEVFNIIDLVFPEFLKQSQPGFVTRRLLNVDADATGATLVSLFDTLEEAILSQYTHHGDKIGCLTELRMLTSKIIYNHKGEHLLEDSCLVDLTVVLKLTLNQRSAWEIERNSKGKGFKTYSTLSGITLHPKLCVFSDRPKGLPAPSEDEMDELLKDVDVLDGVKTKFLLDLVKLCGYTNEKILVVSQYVIPLMFLQRLMAKTKGWKDGKETFMVQGMTSLSARENAFNQFNNSPDAKVFFASIKACSEEITLEGVTRVVMLDIIVTPSIAQQVIEMAYHPGEEQQKKVYSYRLVAADTSEEDQEMNSATKEIVSGIWFDGNSYPLDGKLQIPIIDAKFIDDNFLEASFMSEDIKTIYKRLVISFNF
ncbi:unnamed protein product [Arabis nemorensis]|uniref:Helicase ATP-binding domain-containing protein n=1 Tax=Arabis nemorensis TaxID=586526 RepID=A0A565BSY6_9BRAS|nr:unnamed protein product [Arabis nemorensis]